MKITFGSTEFIYPDNVHVAIEGCELMSGKVTIEYNWISVKEKFPKKGLNVLVYNGTECSVSSYISEDSHLRGLHIWSHNNEMYNYKDVTHWMLLPKPPKGVSQ